MSAYLFVDLDVFDPAGFEQYRAGMPALISKHGGKYLVRGGEVEVIEGGFTPHRMVLFEFPDRQSIRQLLADPEYALQKAQRAKVARSIIIAMDGV